MIEPISVGVIVAALLAKTLSRAEDGVVDGAVEFGRKALQVLHRRFSKDGDAEAARALRELVETPDSERREKTLAVLLEDRAKHSTELRDELKAIIEQGKKAGVVVGPIDQAAEGDGNVQIAGNVDGQISVNQSPQPRD